MFTFRFVVKDEKLMLGLLSRCSQATNSRRKISVKFECFSFVKTKNAVGNQRKVASKCVMICILLFAVIKSKCVCCMKTKVICFQTV